jgi:uncharacterized protein (TIGR03437 family)
MLRNQSFAKEVAIFITVTRLFTILAALLLLTGASCFAQVITTYAGSDALFTAIGQQATAVRFGQPAGVAVDQAGNVYIAATGQSMVLKVAPNGTISVAAGDGLARYAGDGGPAVAGSLASITNQLPNGLAFDAAGNLYIADQANNVIRRVDTSGVIVTVAGNGNAGYNGDGIPATKATLFQPSGIAVDGAGNLYIADTENYRVRMVNTDGIISTLAGTGASGYSGDGGPASQALVHQPAGVTLDGAGNVYVADTNNFVVRKITPLGTITTVVGTGRYGSSGDGGPATKATLSQVVDMKFDAAGNLYIADLQNGRIRRVDTSGTITTIAGTGQNGFGGDGGPAASAVFNGPIALAIDSTGAVIVADLNNNRVRRVVPGGAVSTIAGQTLTIGDGGSSTLARMTNPLNIAVDTAFNLYIADSGENRIRKVATSGTITTFAGTGAAAESGDGGPASAAALRVPDGVAVDSAGNVYIADSGNGVIRKVNAATGVISVIAGNGSCCYAGTGTGGDGGPATSATLFYPRAVAVDGSGNIYLQESVLGPNNTGQGTCVRRVTADGKINIYAGGGLAGFSGDGGPATQAAFGNDMVNLAVASDGTLYIPDPVNNRVRRVDPVTQIITTVAGNGQSTVSGDGGPATAAGLPFPTSIAVDGKGNLYIGGSGYVRMVNTQGVISTYAGDGTYGFSGDGGPAKSASMTSIPGLAVDPSGNLYLTDEFNNRVRIMQPAGAALGVAPASLAFTSTGATSQTFAVSATGGTLSWSAAASTVTGGAWLSVSPASGSSPAGGAGTTVTVTVNSTGLAAGAYYGEIQVTSSDASDPVELVTVSLTIGAAATTPPSVAAGGVLSNASYSLQTPLAPGMLVSIFGSNLTAAGQVYTAPAYPLPTQMGGVTVTIGGELVPLYAVTPGQINAVLPFDLPVNTTLPLIVTYNNAVSAPEPVTMVASEPGIFTLSENGQGTGIVVLIHPDGSQAIVGPANPAAAGDILVIYCTGLGDTNPRGVAGSPAPVTPLAQAIDPVTATLGGVKVPVSFAGPTPGYAALYQVNATVPAGIAASSTAPLILTQSGRSSPSAVTIPVQ